MLREQQSNHFKKRLKEEDAAKLDHMEQKAAENSEKLKESMPGCLSSLNDGVVAIFITVMMLEIPFPTSREEFMSFTWSIAVFFVSFFITAGFWCENKKIFQTMREADHFTVVMNFMYLAVLALIPATTKWILNSPDKYAAITFGVVYFLTTFSQESLRFAVLRKRFTNHKSVFVKLVLSRAAIMLVMLAALLVLSWFFPRAAILLYVALPVKTFFMPERRRKTGGEISGQPAGTADRSRPDRNRR